MMSPVLSAVAALEVPPVHAGAAGGIAVHRSRSCSAPERLAPTRGIELCFGTHNEGFPRQNASGPDRQASSIDENLQARPFGHHRARLRRVLPAVLRLPGPPLGAQVGTLPPDL